MKTFTFYQDIKVQAWARTAFEVEAKNEEEAKKIATKFIKENIRDTDEYEDQELETEYLFDTEKEMTPEQNNGYSTIEILDDKKNTIARNSAK